ncbi:hypothetical protein BO82DRAFT_418902 [Aspergillus uvarum CBS 121591]|uniref:Phytanoyl-CoA dioxygenase n=1 Tax=Aspergillus uvarum CBS 121591 TaxID=1448315 RepID=A0A319E5E4_9EURO|nr:hypothetical protein BO82DRAFT_418902 [Aspergillus uvarum CBS 121591]PYH86352.1 hypothetical protein BO82DRAFT_418902 [Aspergillus uvarum CBS 121591]
MRERFLREGYVPTPQDKALDFRRRYFFHMAPSGLLKDGSDPVDRIFNEKVTRKFLPPGDLRRLLGLQNDAESDEYLKRMISAHERTMLRAFMYLRADPPTSLTAWVPIGDVSLEAGGLMYLEKSTEIGRRTGEEFRRNAGNFTDEKRNRKWLITKYEAGDVIFHDPFLVHATCNNKDPKRKIRLATDLRFVDANLTYDQVGSHSSCHVQ